MKQNIFMAALLAAMLVIAGCGGGSSSSSSDTTTTETPKTKAEFSTAIGACTTEACVNGLITQIEGSTLSEADKMALETEAEDKIAMLPSEDNTTLAGLSKTAAEELLDAIAGGEALELDSDHINTTNAELTDNEPWKKATGTPIGGWEARSYQIPNPAGSSGRIQDIRVWQENPVYLSQKYEEFFSAGNKGITDGNIRGSIITDFSSAPLSVTDAGAVYLVVTNMIKNKQVVPSNFYTNGFTYNADNQRWELRGDFYDVPGVFVCNSNPCNQQRGDFDNNPDTPETVETVDDGNRIAGQKSLPISPTSVADVYFVPQNFDKDETKVDAKWAKLQNPNFLNFGVYWHTDVNDDDEVTSISVDPFAGGGTRYSSTGDIVRSGDGILTAKYSGGAGGVYVRTITDDNDDRVATGYGEFTADANFTAKFGAGTNKDTLSGTISNFKTISKTGADAISTWEIELSGDIEAGVVEKADTFHAQFYGNVADKRQSNGHGYAPYGLVGTFQSGEQLDDGHVTGAFGTECDGSNCVQN